MPKINTSEHCMIDDLMDGVSKLLIYIGSLFAAMFAWVETHHNTVGLIISAVGIFGGLAISFWHKRRMQHLREIEIRRRLQCIADGQEEESW